MVIERIMLVNHRRETASSFRFVSYLRTRRHNRFGQDFTFLSKLSVTEMGQAFVLELKIDDNSMMRNTSPHGQS